MREYFYQGGTMASVSLPLFTPDLINKSIVLKYRAYGNRLTTVLSVIVYHGKNTYNLRLPINWWLSL